MKKYNILSNAQYVDCPFDASGNLKAGRSMSELTAWYEYAVELGFLTPDQLCVTVTYSAASDIQLISGTTLQGSIEAIYNGTSLVASGIDSCRTFVSETRTLSAESTFRFLILAETYTDLFKNAFLNNTAVTNIVFNNWNTVAAGQTYSGMFLNAFKGCSNLTSITLPLYNLNSLGTDPAVTDMFDGCTSLEKIYAYNAFSCDKTWASTSEDILVPHKGVTVYNSGDVPADKFSNLKCIEPTITEEVTFPYTVTGTETTIATSDSNSSWFDASLKCTGSSVTEEVTLPYEVAAGDSVVIATCTCDPTEFAMTFYQDSEFLPATIDTSTNPWSVSYEWWGVLTRVGSLSYTGSSPYTLTFTNEHTGAHVIGSVSGPAVSASLDKSNPSSWVIKRNDVPCGNINFSSTSPVTISAVSTATDIEITSVKAVDALVFVPDLVRAYYYTWNPSAATDYMELGLPCVDGCATISSMPFDQASSYTQLTNIEVLYNGVYYPIVDFDTDTSTLTMGAVCIPPGSTIDMRFTVAGVTYESLAEFHNSAGLDCRFAHHANSAGSVVNNERYAPGIKVTLGAIGISYTVPAPDEDVIVTVGAADYIVGHSGANGCIVFKQYVDGVSVPITTSYNEAFTIDDADIYNLYLDI